MAAKLTSLTQKIAIIRDHSGRMLYCLSFAVLAPSLGTLDPLYHTCASNRQSKIITLLFGVAQLTILPLVCHS